jgi:hypothetical protein
MNGWSPPVSTQFYQPLSETHIKENYSGRWERVLLLRGLTHQRLAIPQSLERSNDVHVWLKVCSASWGTDVDHTLDGNVYWCHSSNGWATYVIRLETRSGMSCSSRVILGRAGAATKKVILKDDVGRSSTIRAKRAMSGLTCPVVVGYKVSQQVCKVVFWDIPQASGACATRCMVVMSRNYDDNRLERRLVV